MRKDMTMDMCSGPLFGNLLRFSVPLMLSGILQLLFNSADIIVLGQFAGGNAMAAVGSTSSLNHLIVNLFLGLSSGGSVVVAQYFGMKSQKDIEESVHTSILLGLISGLVLVAVGLILGVTAVIFGTQLLSIYSPEPEIVAYGLDRLRLIGLTYFLCGLMDTVCGYIRGMGTSIAPTLISLTGACGLRIVWIFTIFASTRSLFILYLSYPVSWFVTYAANLVCFAVTSRRWKKRVSTSQAMVNGYPVG